MPTAIGVADTGGTVTDGTTISRSWTSTAGSRSAIVVHLPYYNSNSTVIVSSASWGATSLTRWSGNPGTPTTDDYAGEIWGAVLGASHGGATNTLSVTFSGNVYCNAIIQQYDNVNQSSPTHDGGREATVESGTASVSIANCVASDYLLGTFVKPDSANVYTLGGGATQVYQGNISGLTTRRVIAMYRTGVTGTQAVSATFPSTFHAGGAVALVDDPGSGGAALWAQSLL